VRGSFISHSSIQQCEVVSYHTALYCSTISLSPSLSLHHSVLHIIQHISTSLCNEDFTSTSWPPVCYLVTQLCRGHTSNCQTGTRFTVQDVDSGEEGAQLSSSSRPISTVYRALDYLMVCRHFKRSFTPGNANRETLFYSRKCNLILLTYPVR
jgi:hypothetical protein